MGEALNIPASLTAQNNHGVVIQIIQSWDSYEKAY